MGGSKEEDELEQKGFRIGVDLHLGAIRSLSKRERERERKHNHKRVQRGKRKGKYALNLHEHMM